jgi:hypothetical protein
MFNFGGRALVAEALAVIRRSMDSIKPRPITEQERAWLMRGLESLPTGEYQGGGKWIEVETNQVKPLDEPVDPTLWLEQIDGLMVVGQCMCGESNCHTVRFRRAGEGRVVALATSSTADRRMLIIHIDDDSGELAELEII